LNGNKAGSYGRVNRVISINALTIKALTLTALTIKASILIVNADNQLNTYFTITINCPSKGFWWYRIIENL